MLSHLSVLNSDESVMMLFHVSDKITRVFWCEDRMYFGYPLHFTSILNSDESVTTLFSVSDKITEYFGVKIGMYFGYPLHCTSKVVF